MLITGSQVYANGGVKCKYKTPSSSERAQTNTTHEIETTLSKGIRQKT